MRRLISSALAAGAVLSVAASAQGAFHLWRFSELYSDSTGNVQFIEMFTTFSGQQFMPGHGIRSTNAAGTISIDFNFPTNTCTPTNNKNILIATASVGALPGGVTPDYVIPANFLFKEGGTLVFGIAPAQQTIIYGPLPTNGTSSLRASAYVTAPPYSFVVDTNSPKNCAGATGSLNVPPPNCPGDLNGDLQRNTGDLTVFLGQFGQSGPGLVGDLNGDQTVNTGDLTVFLGLFGTPCP